MKKISLILLSMLALLVSACSDKDTASDTLRSEMYREVMSADKMVFASMSVKKTVKTDRTDWYKIGKRIAVYSYDSYLRAYIDLDSFSSDDMEFDDDAKIVKVTLPPVKVEVAGRDMEMKKVYENIGILRSNVDSRERAEMKERANASFLKEVERNPEFDQRLISEAERKARTYFQSIFSSFGYTAEITFRK